VRDDTFGLHKDLALLPCTLQTCPDTLLDHAPLELSEYSSHLEHSFPRGGAGVDVLLMDVEIHTLGMDVIEETDQVLQ
jgi:hypothetical protein